MQIAGLVLPRAGVSGTRWPAVALRVVLAGLAIACALLAQHPGSANAVPLWVIAVSLLAIIGGAISLPNPVRAEASEIVATEERVGQIGPLAAALGVPALLAVLIWLREPFSRYGLYTLDSSSLGAVLWLLGIVLGLGLAWPLRRERALAPLLRSPLFWLEVLALLVVLDLAAGLRLYHLGTLPQGIWWDEADFATSAQMLQHLPFQPFGAGNAGHNPSLYFYVMAVLLKLGNVSVGTARLTSALFGLAAVVAVYLLGRKVGGAPLGLCAAALLAMAQWAVDFSRFAMSNIAAPAMIGLGFVALATAMQRPRGIWFALTGTLMGLTLLTYAGGFLAGGGVAFAVVALRLLTVRRFRETAWPGVLLLPLGFVVGAAPFLLMALVDPGYTLDRERTVSLFNEVSGLHAQLAALGNNLRLHLLMFTVAGDSNGRHNLPGAPMLDPVTGACFLLGLGVCLRRLHHWFYQLLLLWLAASMAGGVLSLSFEAPQGARTIGAIAPIALIAALPLASLAALCWRGLLRLRPQRDGDSTAPQTPTLHAAFAAAVAGLVVAVPLGVAFARNTDQYFVRQANSLDAWSAMDGLQTILGRAALRLHQQGYTVKMQPSLAGDPVITFAAKGFVVPPFDTGTPVTLPIPAGGLALLIPKDFADTLALVQRAYPTAKLIPLTPSFDHSSVQANAVLITPADAAHNLGIQVAFGGSHGYTRSHLQGAVPWPAGSGPTTPVTFSGTLLISSQQAWQPLALRLAGARHAAITIDGQTWQRPDNATEPIRLGAGDHRLIVRGTGTAAATVGLEWANQIAAYARVWEPLPPLLLQAPTLPTGGLLGLYYRNVQPTAMPDLARVDQTIHAYYQTPPGDLSFPFGARWLGTLRIDQPGDYGFSLDSTGPSQLAIDGRTVVRTAHSPTSGSVALSAGTHRIQVDYSATGGYLHCYLTWQPPGGVSAPIPATFTEPAHG